MTVIGWIGSAHGRSDGGAPRRGRARGRRGRRRPAAIERRRERHPPGRYDAATAARDADVVFTSLPRSEHVREVLGGKDAEHRRACSAVVRRGTLVLDTSTVDVETSRACHEAGVDSRHPLRRLARVGRHRRARTPARSRSCSAATRRPPRRPRSSCSRWPGTCSSSAVRPPGSPRSSRTTSCSSSRCSASSEGARLAASLGLDPTVFHDIARCRRATPGRCAPGIPCPASSRPARRTATSTPRSPPGSPRRTSPTRSPRARPPGSTSPRGGSRTTGSSGSSTRATARRTAASSSSTSAATGAPPGSTRVRRREARPAGRVRPAHARRPGGGSGRASRAHPALGTLDEAAREDTVAMRWLPDGCRDMRKRRVRRAPRTSFDRSALPRGQDRRRSTRCSRRGLLMAESAGRRAAEEPPHRRRADRATSDTIRRACRTRVWRAIVILPNTRASEADRGRRAPRRRAPERAPARGALAGPARLPPRTTFSQPCATTAEKVHARSRRRSGRQRETDAAYIDDSSGDPDRPRQTRGHGWAPRSSRSSTGAGRASTRSRLTPSTAPSGWRSWPTTWLADLARLAGRGAPSRVDPRRRRPKRDDPALSPLAVVYLVLAVGGRWAPGGST